jgi:hypothetical protein
MYEKLHEPGEIESVHQYYEGFYELLNFGELFGSKM